MASSIAEFGWQFHQFHDGSAMFRRLPIKFGCLVEEKDGKIIRAWPYLDKLLKKFDGFKNVPGGKILVTDAVVAIRDDFKQLKDEEKGHGSILVDGKTVSRKRILRAQIINECVRILSGKIKPSAIADKAMLVEIGVICLLTLGLLVKVLISRGGA